MMVSMVMTKMVVGVCGDAGGSGDVDVNDDDDGFVAVKYLKGCIRLFSSSKLTSPVKRKLTHLGHKTQKPGS